MIPNTLLRFKKSIIFPKRSEKTLSWYLLSLAVEAQKHTLSHASQLSGIHVSQFSRVLKKTPETGLHALQECSQKRGKRLRKLEHRLNNELMNAPWSVALIIDSTLHQRSQLKGQNVQRLNHGGGFVIGHRWTNVCLFFAGHLIPLPPIEFLTRKHCRNTGVPYQTEHERIVQFLQSLKLEDWIGEHDPKEIVVLMDSGYDSKEIQKTILSRGWDFLMALKSLRKSWISNPNQGSLGAQPQWTGIKKLFKRFKSRAPRATVRLRSTHGSKKTRVFDSRRLEGRLFGVPGSMILLASKKKGEKDWKYLACSRLGLPTSVIMISYQIRFSIEQFHKDTKQYLGLQDAGLKNYCAVKSHVHWVYVTYLMLHDFELPLIPIGTRERQKILMRMIQSEEYGSLIQLSSRINGSEEVKKYCQKKHEALYAA